MVEYYVLCIDTYWIFLGFFFGYFPWVWVWVHKYNIWVWVWVCKYIIYPVGVGVGVWSVGVFPKEGKAELKDAGKGGFVTIQQPLSVVLAVLLFGRVNLNLKP